MIDFLASLPEGILTEIIAGIVWLISAYFFHVLIDAVKIHWLLRDKTMIRAFFGYKEKEKVFIIIGTSPHFGRSNREYPSIIAQTAFIIPYLIAELKCLYSDKIEVNVILDQYVTEKHLHENLILISGPSTNSILNKLFKENALWACKYRENVDYSLSQNRYFQDSIGNKFYFQHKEDKVKDHSLIVKITNPLSPNKAIISLFGTESFGTSGAILGLLSFDDIIKNGKFSRRELRSQKKSSHLEIILRINAVGQTYSEKTEVMSMMWYEQKSGIMKSENIPYSITVPKIWY